MPVVSWPISFPNPDTGVSASVGESVTVTKMDSGEYRQRHDRVGRSETYQVSLTLRTFQLGMFVSWFKYKLGHGRNPFALPLPAGSGFTPTNVRFSKSGMKVSLIQLPFLWSVSFEVETNSKIASL